MAQLEPLARRVQQRLGGPAPYVRIMERHRPMVKPLREHTGRRDRDAAVDSARHGRHRLPHRVRQCRQPVHRSRREPAPRPGGAARARGGTLRSGALAGGRGPSSGRGRRHAGALIAWAGVPLLVRAAPDAVAGGFGGAPIPGLATAGLDLTALLFTAGISVLAAFAFGVLPALPLLRVAARQPAAGRTWRRRRRSLTRDALVVVQTASALVLLVGSALLMRSFWQLSDVDAGYDTKDIFTFQIAPNRPELNDRTAVSQFQYASWIDLKALPGVESVGFITTLPLDEGAGTKTSRRPRFSRAARRRLSFASRAPAAPYFQTMGIELKQGRLLRAHRGRTRGSAT